MGLLGVVIAGVVLLFARPRLRVGAAGLSVRNLLGDKLVPWTDVVDVSFPPGARWARVDLPDDEYIPVMAIQAVDKEPCRRGDGHRARADGQVPRRRPAVVDLCVRGAIAPMTRTQNAARGEVGGGY